MFTLDGHDVLSRWRSDGKSASDTRIENALAFAQTTDGAIVAVTKAGVVVRKATTLQLAVDRPLPMSPRSG